MADDVEIDLEKMSLWTAEQATTYFESGGTEEPAGAAATAQLPLCDTETWLKWFPKTKVMGKVHYQQPPKFRMICFHPAGCAETVWSGKGMRQPEDNPFVKHCLANGGELLACELPGREQRRKEPRFTEYGPYCELLFPVLAPVLQQGIPYVMAGCARAACRPKTGTASARPHSPRESPIGRAPPPQALDGHLAALRVCQAARAQGDPAATAGGHLPSPSTPSGPVTAALDSVMLDHPYMRMCMSTCMWICICPRRPCWHLQCCVPRTRQNSRALAAHARPSLRSSSRASRRLT